MSPDSRSGTTLAQVGCRAGMLGVATLPPAPGFGAAPASMPRRTWIARLRFPAWSIVTDGPRGTVWPRIFRGCLAARPVWPALWPALWPKGRVTAPNDGLVTTLLRRQVLVGSASLPRKAAAMRTSAFPNPVNPRRRTLPSRPAAPFSGLVWPPRPLRPKGRPQGSDVGPWQRCSPRFRRRPASLPRRAAAAADACRRLQGGRCLPAGLRAPSVQRRALAFYTTPRQPCQVRSHATTASTRSRAHRAASRPRSASAVRASAPRQSLETIERPAMHRRCSKSAETETTRSRHGASDTAHAGARSALSLAARSGLSRCRPTVLRGGAPLRNRQCTRPNSQASPPATACPAAAGIAGGSARPLRTAGYRTAHFRRIIDNIIAVSSEKSSKKMR
jgi:hypothetical protein